MINVLIAESSSVIGNHVKIILESAGGFRISGIVNNGADAVSLNQKLNPDIIIMELSLPKMSGLDALKRIMETHPVPVVICYSDYDSTDRNELFAALEAGAVAITRRPHILDDSSQRHITEQFINALRLMSEIKVVKRNAEKTAVIPAESSEPLSALLQHRIKIIGIGSSAGGPQVLEKIFSLLDDPFRIPILCVQHIADGFIDGFKEWLNQSSRLSVRIASDDEIPTAGNIYLAPDGRHMEYSASGAIALNCDEPRNGSRPSISVLLRSLAINAGSSAAGILVSGMGKDGASELLELKKRGGVTIAQDTKSALINGIPGEAIKLGAAQYTLTPSQIAQFLNTLSGAVIP